MERSQEQQGSTGMNHDLSPYNQMHLDMETSPLSDPQLKDTDSFKEEQVPRVRKPYTITKQRERWTEEEDNKFLEALQLYGRAWRQIEEHIGSKTAVQIRSHAQKFFSKVVRESGSNHRLGQALKSIEIPPPRPKRKPMHPYPRKMCNVSKKGILRQAEESHLLIPTVFEQENGSPTSVLSAVGSETLGSTFSNGRIGSKSPIASAADSNDQEGEQSLIMALQEEHKPPCIATTAPNVTKEGQPQMDADQCSNVHASAEAHQSTIKLFGKMVVPNNPSRPCSSNAENMAMPKQTPPADNTGNHYNEACKLQMNHACPGLVPFFYCFPLVGDNSIDPAFLSSPWGAMHGSYPFRLVHPQHQYPLQLSMGNAGYQDLQRECSWTGSNTASNSGVVLNETEGVDLNKAKFLTESRIVEWSDVNLTSSSAPKSRSVGSSGRGFVPYRRCAVESERQHSSAANDDEECQAIRLHL
ncbi:uncharacterized protein LOC121985568 [Zingiber officinale]|uniref:MYB protein n=1 Tax=Zingiber officinale TaxID=94328 RepID=A0A8J5LQN0_ZINOF|nr:uncharacterized protein LOC121985568 [Zingiber officinale]KAG6534325.1 hypothetical protein ZIOFF_008211 [Zingiber officinale]WLQ69653.1 MYB protein [Zingiber officinale]